MILSTLSLRPCSFILFGSLILALSLSGCSRESPAPAEVLPAELQVPVRIDSLIAAPVSVDYSSVSKQGQGPSGSLIYSAPVAAPNGNFTAYTYDAQRRLIGKYERTSYGYDMIRAIRYEGSLLAEAYVGGFYPNQPDQGVKTWSITRYRYDTQQRVALALTYINLDGRYKLDQTVRYEYGNAGQLQLTRLTVAISSGYNQMTLQYWSDGDIYRVEQYNPGQSPVASSVRALYNQVENPLARLHAWPENPVSRHYFTGYTAQEEYQYRYFYDNQNRLINYQQREFRFIENQWGDWINRYEFSYAP